MDRSPTPDPATEPSFYSGSLADIFTNDTRLLDVRAPGEFAHGAFPNATNIPLLDDEQRHQIGIRYKQAGQQAAIKLGHELISGQLKVSRLSAWQEFLTRNPGSLLYCFRGGLRSEIVQQWLLESGFEIPRIKGGYKALRRYLIESLQASIGRHKFLVIAGKTGCGKTRLLEHLPASIDLEGDANHRGSAFGRRVDGQPGQIDFENTLASQFIKLSVNNYKTVFLEDESRAIGSLSLPAELSAKMKISPLAVIEESLASRVNVILDDYILANYRDFQARFPQTTNEEFANFLTGSLDRIKKRLGEPNHGLILADMEAALNAHESSGDTSGHRVWIERLLVNYYDPMYDYQLARKLDRVVFRGTRDELLAWASHLQVSQSDTGASAVSQSAS